MDKKESIKTLEKIVWTYEEGRAWLKNTKINSIVERIISLVFGRRWAKTFDEVVASKQASAGISSKESISKESISKESNLKKTF